MMMGDIPQVTTKAKAEAVCNALRWRIVKASISKTITIWVENPVEFFGMRTLVKSVNCALQSRWQTLTPAEREAVKKIVEAEDDRAG